MKSSICLFSGAAGYPGNNDSRFTANKITAAQVPAESEINAVDIADPVSTEDYLDFFMFRMGL